MNQVDDDNNLREVLDPLMLEFGAAVYICQCLESSLCFGLALASDHAGKDFGSSFDFHSRSTLGRLMRELDAAVGVPAELSEELKEALILRNQIVHGYLVQTNGEKIITPKGRLEIMRELRTIRQNVAATDRKLNSILDEFLKKYGVTTRYFRQRAGIVWDYFNSTANNGEVH